MFLIFNMNYTLSVPVAVPFASLGSLISARLHRVVLAVLVYTVEALSVLGWIATTPSVGQIGQGVAVVAVSSALFIALGWTGRRLVPPPQPDTDADVVNGKVVNNDITRIIVQSANCK
jgi:hypothetical protein